MERLQITDDVTALYNKRHISTRASTPRSRRRSGTATSCRSWCSSIDNFKALSERHGLPVGNEVLSDFGKLLKSLARGTDCVARYSGEEFMILLPHTDAPDARRAADRIRDGRGGAFVPAPEAPP